MSAPLTQCELILVALHSDRVSGLCVFQEFQMIFGISTAQVEAVGTPDSAGDNIGRKSVVSVSIHGRFSQFLALNLAICSQSTPLSSSSKTLARDKAVGPPLGRERAPFNGYPVHHSAFTLIVIQRPVPGGSVIPHCDRARLPFETMMESISSENMCIQR